MPLRFGEMALQLGVLKPEQVEEALRSQASLKRQAKTRSIGACLHDAGALDLVQVQQIMTQLGYEDEQCRLIPDVELRELLGRGASGAVYRGFSAGLGEEVAVKVWAPKKNTEDPSGKRFDREAGLGVRLNHPNLVRTFAAGSTTDFSFHVLEFVDGESLDAILARDQRLPPALVTEIGLQIAAALECAASHAIVHRDVKPANIILAKNGRVKLCDLGLAKDLGPKVEALTRSGTLLGSPFYISPEYAQSGKLDPRSDIYGLGATLFHCAVGEVPFPGKRVVKILEAVVRNPTPICCEIRPEVPLALSDVILNMMEKHPGKRYQTATVVKQAFQALKDKHKPPSPPGLLRRFFSRLRTKWKT